MKQLLFIGLFSLAILQLIPPCAACIVIVKTKDAIYVGADSRVVFGTTPVDNVCKIHKSGSFYFAIAGIGQQAQAMLAAQACLGAKSLDEVKAKYIKLVTTSLGEHMKALKSRNAYEYYARANSSNLATITFFRIENAKPKLATVFFKIADPSATEVIITPVEGMNQSTFEIGGQDRYQSMPEVEKKRYKTLQQANPFAYIKSRIGYERRFDEKYIGGPINLFRLNTKGEYWEGRQKTCQW